MSLDYQLFEMINRFAGQNHFLDQSVMFFSEYGPILFGFVLIWLWFSPFGDKEKNRKSVLYALTITFVALGINKAIELMYFRPRPFVSHAVHMLSDKSAADPSFPSNHSAGAFAIAFALFWIRKKLGSVLLIFAFFMALSRIFIGVHYPLDVTAGAIIAFIAAAFVMSQSRYLDSVYNRIIDPLGKTKNETMNRHL
jgi:undecaprenyl-diphosphatase